MIAAPVQCDVDGIPKGLHCVSVAPTGHANKLAKIDTALSLVAAVIMRRGVVLVASSYVALGMFPTYFHLL